MLARTSIAEQREHETRAIRQCLKMLRCIQEEIAEMIPLQIVTTFLLVAQYEGKSLREYTELSGIAQSTMSRHLLDLGERHRAGKKEGYGLVDRRQDPMELRKNEYKLTAKGRKLVTKLTKALTTD
jgi:DNA-binding MarR family transcriptional regulator